VHLGSYGYSALVRKISRSNCSVPFYPQVVIHPNYPTLRQRLAEGWTHKLFAKGCATRHRKQRPGLHFTPHICEQ